MLYGQYVFVPVLDQMMTFTEYVACIKENPVWTFEGEPEDKPLPGQPIGMIPLC